MNKFSKNREFTIPSGPPGTGMNGTSHAEGQNSFQGTVPIHPPRYKPQVESDVQKPVQNWGRPQISLQVIAQKLEKLRFKRAFFGASEKDVWHKISRLDEMYRELFSQQELKYQSLLKERDDLISQLKNDSNLRL